MLKRLTLWPFPVRGFDRRKRGSGRKGGASGKHQGSVRPEGESSVQKSGSKESEHLVVISGRGAVETLVKGLVQGEEGLSHEVPFFLGAESGEKGGGESLRTIPGGPAKEGVGVERDTGASVKGLEHARHAGEQALLQRAVWLKEAGPEIAADRVVASDRSRDGIGTDMAILRHEDPVRDKAVGGDGGHMGQGGLEDLSPVEAGGNGGKPDQELGRQVAGIQAGGPVGKAKAPGSRKEGPSVSIQEGDFIFFDQGEKASALGPVFRNLPDPACLDQGVGDPAIGVGGRVVVQDPPASVRSFSPEPGRKMGRQVSPGQVVGDPGEDVPKGSLVSRDQGKEERVGLSFRGAPVMVRAVDHPPVPLQKGLPEMVPERPGGIG